MSVKKRMFQQGTILNEVVVGVFRANGTTLSKWRAQNDVSPTQAQNALCGTSIRKQKMLPECPRKASAAQGGFGQTTTGQNRPTKAQWNMIGGLARDLGSDQRLEDYRLRNFVKRTAKVSVPKFMTRKDASKVILGLEEWVRQRAANGGEVPDAVS